MYVIHHLKCFQFKLLFALLFTMIVMQKDANSQSVDHWETIVYNTNVWHYFVGSQAPPENWKENDFDQNDWAFGIGGFGYGDDDDGTVIPPTISVYLRRKFTVLDKSILKMAVLHADYDDGFVAYLNGVEIARRNLGDVGSTPTYFQASDTYSEASLYRGELPEAFTFNEAQLNNLLREGDNVLAIQVHNNWLESSDLSSNFFFSVGVSTQEQTYGITPNWFVEPLISSNLPIITITTTETSEIFDEPKVKAHMGIIDNGPENRNKLTDPFNGYDGSISIEIRGASSQSFPKKNYGFETQTEEGENLNVSLLGMPEENDWILHGPFSDKSLLRNVLAYHMGELTDRYAPRTRLCELVVNNDYRGVYILTERIKRDKNRVDIAKLTAEDDFGDELTGGYILQIDRDDEETNQDGWYSNYPDYKFFAFDDPDYDELLSIQKNYIRNHMNEFEQIMASSLYQQEYENYIDVESYIDYFLVTEIGKHIDAYKLSFFMYKDKDSDGGKIHLGPLWDFNLAFGNFDFGCSPEPDGWSYRFEDECPYPTPFWVRKIIDIPQMSHQTNCRWQSLRAGPLSTESLLAFIDEKVEFLEESSQRNFDRWKVLGEYVWPNNFVGDTYAEEVAYLKDWLVERLEWMDENMIGDCELFVDVAEENIAGRIDVFPNPAQEYIQIEVDVLKEGEISFQLHDLLGKEYLKLPLVNKSTTVSLEGVPAGLYVYVITQDGDRIGTGKIVVMEN